MCNVDVLIDCYVNKRMTLKEISDSYGVSVSTLRRVLIKNDVKLRPKGNMEGREYHPVAWNKQTVNDDTELIRLFNMCLSVKEISKRLSVSSKTVYRRIKELGIERPRSMMARDQYDDSMDSEMIRLYKEGKSSNDIGKILGVTHKTVLRHLHHHGLGRSISQAQYAMRQKEQPKDFDSYEVMYDLYVTNRLSKREIADLYGTNGNTIDRVLKKHGIKIRGCSESKIGLMAGEKHPNWKGGRTPLYARLREFFSVNIAGEIIKRDRHTCQLCKKKRGAMHVHHIKHFKDIFEEILSEHPNLIVGKDDDKLYEIITNDERFLDRDNLITYCKECHLYGVHGYKRRDIC